MRMYLNNYYYKTRGRSNWGKAEKEIVKDVTDELDNHEKGHIAAYIDNIMPPFNVPKNKRSMQEFMLAMAEAQYHQEIQAYLNQLTSSHFPHELGVMSIALNSVIENKPVPSHDWHQRALISLYNRMVEVASKDPRSYGFILSGDKSNEFKEIQAQLFYVLITNAKAKEMIVRQVDQGHREEMAKLTQAAAMPNSSGEGSESKDKKKDTGSSAMITKGGIDLNPAQMSLQVKNGPQDFKFDFNGTEIDAAQVSGATFTIRSMKPVTDFPAILGFKNRGQGHISLNTYETP